MTYTREQIKQLGSMLNKSVQPRLLVALDVFYISVQDDWYIFRVVENNTEDKEVVVDAYENGKFSSNPNEEMVLAWSDLKQAKYYKLIDAPVSLTSERAELIKKLALLKEVQSLDRRIAKLKGQGKAFGTSAKRRAEAMREAHPAVPNLPASRVAWLIGEVTLAIHISRKKDFLGCTVQITHCEDGQHYVGILRDVTFDKDSKTATYDVEFAGSDLLYVFDSQDYVVEEVGKTLFLTPADEI